MTDTYLLINFDHRPVKSKKSDKQKQIEEEEAERLREQDRQKAERARKEAGELF